MSKAAIQSLTILAVATGSIKKISMENIGGDAAPTIAYLEDRAQEVVNRWPVVGDDLKHRIKVRRHIHNIRNEIDSAAKLFSACCFGMLAQELLIRLYEKLKDREKLSLVEELLESVNNAVDIYDPKEQQGESRAEAERLCGIIMKEIGWI